MTDEAHGEAQIVSLTPASPGWRIARTRETLVEELESPISPSDLAEWVRDADLSSLYEEVPVAAFALVRVDGVERLESVVRGTYIDGTHDDLHPAYGIGAIAILGPGQFVEEVLVGEEAETTARVTAFSDLTFWLYCDDHDEEIKEAFALLRH